MTLDVLISTLGYDGIGRVVAMDLPKVHNVSYIVSWQLPDKSEFPGNVPAELIREDVKVFQLNNRGISINRNNAIVHSTADICLVADDDLTYTKQQLLSIMAAFERNPDYDIITFKYNGNGAKKYPMVAFDLKKPPSGYYVSEVEIAFRRSCCGGKLLFNEYFGPGRHLLQACEGAVFMHSAMSMGAKCRFEPITITRHDGATTGNRSLTPGVLMAQGAYFSIVHPVTAFLRIPLFAWRNSRRGLTRFWPAVKHLLRGYIYGHRHFNSDGSLKRVPESA